MDGMRISITTAEVMSRLAGINDWRRGPLIRYLSYTRGELPPLDFLTNETLTSKKASSRAAALYTLRQRYATGGLSIYVSALRDRYGEVSLLAAAAIAELGDVEQKEDFLEWAKRRISRKTRLHNYDMHELAVMIQFCEGTEALDRLADLLRRYRGNLAPEELSILGEYAHPLLDESVDLRSSGDWSVDLSGIQHWANGVGTIFSSGLESDWVEYAENDMRELLAES